MKFLYIFALYSFLLTHPTLSLAMEQSDEGLEKNEISLAKTFENAGCIVDQESSDFIDNIEKQALTSSVLDMRCINQSFLDKGYLLTDNDQLTLNVLKKMQKGLKILNGEINAGILVFNPHYQPTVFVGEEQLTQLVSAITVNLTEEEIKAQATRFDKEGLKIFSFESTNAQIFIQSLTEKNTLTEAVRLIQKNLHTLHPDLFENNAELKRYKTLFQGMGFLISPYFDFYMKRAITYGHEAHDYGSKYLNDDRASLTSEKLLMIQKNEIFYHMTDDQIHTRFMPIFDKMTSLYLKSLEKNGASIPAIYQHYLNIFNH